MVSNSFEPAVILQYQTYSFELTASNLQRITDEVCVRLTPDLSRLKPHCSSSCSSVHFYYNSFLLRRALVSTIAPLSAQWPLISSSLLRGSIGEPLVSIFKRWICFVDLLYGECVWLFYLTIRQVIHGECTWICLLVIQATGESFASQLVKWALHYSIAQSELLTGVRHSDHWIHHHRCLTI